MKHPNQSTTTNRGWATLSSAILRTEPKARKKDEIGTYIVRGSVLEVAAALAVLLHGSIAK